MTYHRRVYNCPNSFDNGLNYYFLVLKNNHFYYPIVYEEMVEYHNFYN